MFLLMPVMVSFAIALVRSCSCSEALDHRAFIRPLTATGMSDEEVEKQLKGLEDWIKFLRDKTSQEEAKTAATKANLESLRNDLSGSLRKLQEAFSLQEKAVLDLDSRSRMAETAIEEVMSCCINDCISKPDIIHPQYRNDFVGFAIRRQIDYARFCVADGFLLVFQDMGIRPVSRRDSI